MTIPDELRKAIKASVVEMDQPPEITDMIASTLKTIAESGHITHANNAEAIERHVDVIFSRIEARRATKQED